MQCGVVNNVSAVVTDTSADSLNEAVPGPSTSIPKQTCSWPVIQPSELWTPAELFQTDQLQTPAAKTKHLVDCATSPVFANHSGCVLAQLVIALCPSANKKKHTTFAWCLWKWVSHITKWQPRAKQEANHYIQNSSKAQKPSSQVLFSTRTQRAGFVGRIRLDMSGGTAEEDMKQHGRLQMLRTPTAEKKISLPSWTARIHHKTPDEYSIGTRHQK